MFSIFRAGSPARPRRSGSTIGRNEVERELDAVDAIAARLDHLHGYLLGDHDDLVPPAAPVRPLPAQTQPARAGVPRVA